jgi:CBS domain-containing protein
MKGSSISVRIADFLKEHHPFSFFSVEVLRDLANRSKVKFHEDGEIVFSQGQPRNQWLYVIQQGSVKILEESEKGETLVDLRGPGDMLGLQGIRSDEPYLHTCRTETETILYGLPRAQFVETAEKSAQARRYLAAYFSLSPSYQWGGFLHDDDIPGGEKGLVTLRKGGLWEVDPSQHAAREALVTVMGDTEVREVARRLQSKRVDCVVVVDEAGHPIGKLTDGHLRNRLLEGSIQPFAPVRDLMSRSVATASPAENTGDLLIKLTRSGLNFLIVTEDGTLNSRAVGLVSERNLFLQYGRFPSVVGEAISSAPDITSLRSLRDRLEALILEFLESRRSLIWLMEMVGVLNRKMTQRIIELVLESMAGDGYGEPPVDFSWLMMGSGGRDELLIRSAVYHALVYADPDKEEESKVSAYFEKLAQRVSAGHRQCGFLESPQNVLAQKAGWCLPITGMKEKFSNFIRKPVESHVYSARDAFDFKPARGEDCPLAGELSDHIAEELKNNPDFIRYMASDSLLNQPPRTLFSGYVVDQEGIRRDDLAIKSHALLPLVDVGRVLALEAGSHRPTATYKRLDEAAKRARIGTDEGNRLHEASEGFLVAQFARISQGLKLGTDGAFIKPSELDPETRTLLITTFRTIMDILEATAKRFKLSTWKQ